MEKKMIEHSFPVKGYIISSLLWLAAVAGYNCLKKKEIQNEIHTTTNISVKDFAKIENGVEKGTITWEQALDSLKAESKMQKSYFKGAQMVRDSIKNAAKSIK